MTPPAGRPVVVQLVFGVIMEVNLVGQVVVPEIIQPASISLREMVLPHKDIREAPCRLRCQGRLFQLAAAEVQEVLVRQQMAAFMVKAALLWFGQEMVFDMVAAVVAVLQMVRHMLVRLEKILVALRTIRRAVVDMDLLEQTVSPPKRGQPVLDI